MTEASNRIPTHVYCDPLDLVWTVTASRLGLTIKRNSDAYASTDGKGNLHIGSEETLDSDDCLAQMVLHEICHWVSNGIDSVHLIDWGFAPMERVESGELVAIRVQAHLAAQWGLLKLMALTTDSRPYWNQICLAPLEPLDGSDQEAAVVARALEGVAVANQPPFVGPLTEALSASAKIWKAVSEFSRDRPESLW